MLVINFAHPLTAAQLEVLGVRLDAVIGEVKTVPVQADLEYSFAQQAADLVDKIGWTSEQWQANPFVVNLPGLSPMAACLLAEIHGRSGYFPTIIRLAPIPDVKPPQFQVIELIDLAACRSNARTRR